MTTFVKDASRADVRNLLDHAASVLEKYKCLDELRVEQSIETFTGATSQIREESSRYLEPYRLAIVGEFKVGKSSLINAMLGQKNLVAEGVAPTTGAVTELQWAEESIGIVLDAAGRVIFEGDCEVASRYADQRKAEGSKSANKGIRVILKQPTEVLKRLTIIDTPGLGASELDDSVTLNAIHMADAAVLVLAAGRAGGDNPVQMAELLRSANKRITLVISRADLDSSHGKTSAAEMADVFREVIDGPPIIFSSKKIQEALDMAAASAEARDETLAEKALAELDEWGQVELTERILQGHLSSTGSAGVARARAALGELRKRSKTLSVSSAREQDAAAKTVEDITNSLDETERIVADVLDPKIPFIEDRIEDIVDQHVGRLLDNLREAVDVFVDDRMDSGITEGFKALWAKVNDEYDAKRRRELDRHFKKLFPSELVEITTLDIERAVNHLLVAEWTAVVKDVAGKGFTAGISVEDIMKKIDEHLSKVLAALSVNIAASIALLFIPGGFILNIIELVGSVALTKGQMSKQEARVAIIKRQAGLQIRTQRVTIRSQLSCQYYELNKSVHGMVVAKTRRSSNEQTDRRDAASAAFTKWRDAGRDLSSILEAIVDIEQGGL